MNQTRLEVIKSITTDTRHKRVIDELVAEIERLQAIIQEQDRQLVDILKEDINWLEIKISNLVKERE